MILIKMVYKIIINLLMINRRMIIKILMIQIICMKQFLIILRKMSCRSQPDYSDDEVQALFQPYKMKVVENIKIIKAKNIRKLERLFIH